MQAAFAEKGSEKSKQRRVDAQTVLCGEYQNIFAAFEGRKRLKQGAQQRFQSAVRVNTYNLILAELALQFLCYDFCLDRLPVEQILPVSKMPKDSGGLDRKHFGQFFPGSNSFDFMKIFGC